MVVDRIIVESQEIFIEIEKFVPVVEYIEKEIIVPEISYVEIEKIVP